MCEKSAEHSIAAIELDPDATLVTLTVPGVRYESLPGGKALGFSELMPRSVTLRQLAQLLREIETNG
jgi:hypothetical protein